MSGVICIIILEGNKAQGDAAQLAQNIAASCTLVDYLENDDDIEFNPADAQPIADFHVEAQRVIGDLNTKINKLNTALAKKYNRETSDTETPAGSAKTNIGRLGQKIKDTTK